MEHWIVVAATESAPLSINVCVFGICDKKIFYKISELSVRRVEMKVVTNSMEKMNPFL